MIRLLFDQPAPVGPRVFFCGKELRDIFSIELLPLRQCVVKHYNLPLRVVGDEMRFEGLSDEYEIAVAPRVLAAAKAFLAASQTADPKAWAEAGNELEAAVCEAEGRERTGEPFVEQEGRPS